MPRGHTFDSEKRAMIPQLHARGLSLTAIARELGTSPATVSKYARLDGIEFDRAKTKSATAARKIDLAAMRAELAHRLLVEANHFLGSLHKPFVVFNFGGKDNTYEERTLDGPPTADIRNLLTSTGIALQRSLELSKFDADPNEGLSAVDEWLEAMTGCGDEPEAEPESPVEP